jgi:tripartite-type tricarboxylate transporter receptor subunit TctC
VTDLIGGQTHFTIDGMLILIPQVKAGKVRALAVARPERWPDLPDVPTLVESGYPDFIIDAWTGVMAPKGTPPQIVARLNAVINEGLRTPETKAALARFQALPKVSTPQEFESFLKSQLPKWAEMVKLAGAKGE